jgi:hypothetical protein
MAMQRTKLTQEEKAFRNSAVGSFISFSIGLWTISLITFKQAGVSWEVYFMGVLGILSLIFSLLLFLRCNFIKNGVLPYLKKDRTMPIIKLIAWYMVVAAFIVRLFQTEVAWLIVAGLFTMIISVIILLVFVIKNT